MNTSPVSAWSDFNAQSTQAIFTFADQPGVLYGICLLAACVVGWFLVAAFRFDARHND